MSDRAANGQFERGKRASRDTEFRPRQRPSRATEFRKGEHRSLSTEFYPGQPAHNRLPLGTETVRVDPLGNRRSWVKVAEPSTWRPRAIVAWESVHGPLPRGLVVHHKDRDAMNDNINNLIALTRAEHAEEHRGEIIQAKAEAAARSKA